MSDAPLPHPAAFVLESYSVGGLAGPDRQVVATHVEGCDGCRAFLGGLERLAREQLAAEPPVAFAARLAERARTPARRGWALGRWMLAPLAAGAAVVALWALRPGPAEVPLRERGEVSARVYRLRDGAVTRLALTDRVRAGDALRLEVVATHPGFVAAFFLDEACKPSWYVPAAAAEPPLAFPGGELLLPGSAVLDASAAAERAFVVVRPTAKAVEEVVDGVRRACAGRGAARLDEDGWLPAVPGWWSMVLARAP